MDVLIYKTENHNKGHQCYISRQYGKFMVEHFDRTGELVIDVFDRYGGALICARDSIISYMAGMSRNDVEFKELDKDLEALYSA